MRPVRGILRNVIYLVSIGIALHLILPRLPGLKHSAQLALHAAPVLVAIAFVSEALSDICYSELAGRSVALAVRSRTSLRARRRAGIGFWFMLRLTLSGLGASHVLPGGGAAAAAVTFRALKNRRLTPQRIGLALAAATALAYGALGLLLTGSLIYILARHKHGPVGSGAALVALLFTLVLLIGSYIAHRNPRPIRRALGRVIFLVWRILRRRRSRREANERAGRLVEQVRGEIRAARREVRNRPGEAASLAALALGYWGFDALCLIVMFHAFGVPAGTVEILAAYGIATAVAALPLTPGGIGVFETTVLATLALLGVGSDATIPVLGYRIFNFWLPIPLAAILYPTLRIRLKKPIRVR